MRTLTKRVVRENGVAVLVYDDEAEKLVWSREHERKRARAEILADLYEMGELSESTIQQIRESKPEVYEIAAEMVTEQ